MSVLPNIYDREQLIEFAARAGNARAHATTNCARIDALYATNFGIEEPPMAFKGTMERARVASVLAAMRERIFTPHAPEPIGPYSQAILADGVLFCSGQIPIDPADRRTRRRRRRRASRTRACATSKPCSEPPAKHFDDVVETTIYLVDMADFAAVNAVYDRYFGSVKPARSTVAVAALPKGARIEIDCVAPA